jgi:hypothetical protein
LKIHNRIKNQTDLPEFLEIEGTTLAICNGKIPHQEILRSFPRFAHLLDTYRQKILSQKTRTIRLLGKKSSAKILHTLLGYEVQASYKRIQCPDLVTARYIRLFSELGCHTVHLPYDPTLTAELIPEFEATVNDFTHQIRTLFPGDASRQHYVIRRVFEIIRSRLRAP